MQFNIIKEEDFQLMRKIQSGTKYNGSEFSPLYLKGWKFFNFESMQIAYENEVIYIRFIPHADLFDPENGHKGYVYLPPLCKLEKVKDAFEKIKEQTILDKEEFYVMSVPKEYVETLNEDEFKFVFNEDYSEYLYEPNDLINLAGKKYHSKRNHIKKFNSLYGANEEKSGYVFRNYEDTDYENVLKLVLGWQEEKTFNEEYYEDELEEMRLIKMALQRIEICPFCFADVIEYEGNIIAFSMGEVTASNVGITHIEKGNIDYQGVYPTICQMFAEKHFKDCRYINRQEDMGLEGLRKSKRSLYPVAFADKYVVNLK